jgi:hypothetical protein
MKCPECGAQDGACEARYHECLVKEFTDAGYGTVHHLTVAAYMLQHSSKLTLEGWRFERELLQEFIIGNKPPAEIRRRNKDRLDSGNRTWKIASDDGLPKIDRTEWTRTVLDVRMENAEVYRKDVTAWAKSVLEDAVEIKV